jgi:hypothetical protein
MYNIINNSAPSYLSVTLIKDQHSIATRSSHHSVVIPRSGSVGKSSFADTSAIAWNSIPPDIQAIKSKDNFKSNIKSHLFNILSEVEVDDFVFY